MSQHPNHRRGSKQETTAQLPAACSVGDEGRYGWWQTYGCDDPPGLCMPPEGWAPRPGDDRCVAGWYTNGAVWVE